jgi:hypothetical protein
MILTTIIVLVTGLIYMTTAKPYEHGTAPAGDAHLVHIRNPVVAAAGKNT